MRLSKETVPHKRERVKKVGLKCLRYFRQFSEVTTLHGVRYLAERRRTVLERLFWALALALSVFSCWYFVSQVSKNYHSTPVVVTVSTTPTSTSSFPSPAVTVCSTSHHSGAGDTPLEGTSSSGVGFLYCNSDERQDEFLENESLREVLQDFRPMTQRLLASVRHAGRDLVPLSAHVQTVISIASVCVTHNLLPLHHLIRAEYLQVYQFYGLLDEPTGWRAGEQLDWTPSNGFHTTRLNTTPTRLQANAYAAHAEYVVRWDDKGTACDQNEGNIMVLFHNSANVLGATEQTAVLRAGYQVDVDIKPTVTTSDETVKVWSARDRGCYYDNERYLRFFKIYTEPNCKMECKANYSLTHCGCVPFYYPRNLSTPVCGPKKRECVEIIHRNIKLSRATEISCSCQPTCGDISYAIDPHERPWSSSPPDYGNSSAVDSLSRLVLTVNKKYINLFKRTAMMDSVGYLASVGGIFGLFLGISFLSVFEILYYLSLRVLVNIWNSESARHRRIVKPHPLSPALSCHP